MSCGQIFETSLFALDRVLAVKLKSSPKFKNHRSRDPNNKPSMMINRAGDSREEEEQNSDHSPIMDGQKLFTTDTFHST